QPSLGAFFNREMEVDKGRPTAGWSTSGKNVSGQRLVGLFSLIHSSDCKPPDCRCGVHGLPSSILGRLLARVSGYLPYTSSVVFLSAIYARSDCRCGLHHTVSDALRGTSAPNLVGPFC